MPTHSLTSYLSQGLTAPADNDVYKFIIIIQVAVILLLLISFIIVFYRALIVRRKVSELEKLRATDLAETNDLLMEKSENELNLFFQFENVLEELVKMMRKNDIQITKIIEEQHEQRIILEYNLKK